MKKILLFISFGIAALSVWAYDFQSGDLYYNITSHTAPYTVEVTYKKFSSTGNYTGITDVIIPESVTHNNITYSVTKIGEAAFYGCSSLISVHILNTITTIDAMAFCDCSSLATLNIPSSVVKIGIGALENTELYNDQDHWSDGALYIDNCLIKADYYITDYYTIQEGTRLVADDAFSSCDSMTSITIPQSVKHLGAYIFEYCESLTSIVIPNSVLSIGAAVCSNCPALTSIIVEEGNAKYDSRNNCNAIIETETNTLISGCTTTLIPQSVEHIGKWAFWGCEFESFSIPSGIKSIGEEAFGNCQNLERLTCEASVLPEMGVDVFDQESDLLGLYYSTPICHATLYVPAESVEQYKTAEQWKEFGTILPIEQTPNAIDNVLHPTAHTKKVLHNGHLFILRDGKTYNVMGMEITK